MLVSSAKLGGSLVNKVLNSGRMPEMHLPGYNFAGPGTKLKERLLRGDQPKNALDKAAKEHDMEYAIFKDTKDRHVFDKKLQDKAWRIAKNKDAGLQERLEAGLVSGVMAVKRKLGMGGRIKKRSD